MEQTNVKDLPLVQIKTTAPIARDLICRKFKENVEFIIDYSESKFKGKIFVTYLSNLDINVRINLPNQEEALELLVAYLHYPQVANLPDLEDIVINLLLAYQGKPNFLTFDPTEFINANLDILKLWHKRICQLPVYALYIKGGEFKEAAEAFPLDDYESLVGINYVMLIDHDLFSMLIDGVKEEEMTYSPVLFTKYFFKGKNLFNYFVSPNNPLFFVASSTMEQLVAAKELGFQELNELRQYLGEQNVPLI